MIQKKLKKTKDQRLLKFYAIYLLIFFGFLIILNIAPIPQDPAYHNFADQRTFFSLTNFWNVVSNLPFVWVSIIAVRQILKTDKLCYSKTVQPCYLTFFLAIGAVGVGSAYYHLQPDNQTLLWDRLPMTVGFMAFMAIIIAEYISEKAAMASLFPLILAGVSSVVYWYLTEQAGSGDLRFYGLVQFLPMLIIPMILLMFPSRYTHNAYIWGMLATYFVAKLVEMQDVSLYSRIYFGGHAIKHLFAAIGPYLFFMAMQQRKVVVTRSDRKR